MQKKQLLTGLIASIGLVICILDGKTALTGAQTGISLCIRTVIPSLFPFVLFSALLTGSLYGSSVPVFKQFGKILSMPNGSETILISGFLGGYPAGAQAIASAYRNDLIGKTTAERLLSFCSNAGPAFFFGMVAPLFSSVSDAIGLWMIHILAAVYTGMLIPQRNMESPVYIRKKEISTERIMHTSILVMATICGWIMIFRVILEFLERWFFWRLPIVMKVILCSLLELSNGICMLNKISDPGLRYVICSGILAFGGLCITMQTLSVIGPLSVKPYLKGKFIQTVISLILSASVCLNIWMPVLVLLLLSVILLRKTQKSCSNPAVLGV